jgi:surfactin synthase thioesterase subunit
MIRADFCISATYKYYDESPLACSIITLGCLSDNIFDTQDLQLVNKIIDKEIAKCNNYA